MHGTAWRHRPEAGRGLPRLRVTMRLRTWFSTLAAAGVLAASCGGEDEAGSQGAAPPGGHPGTHAVVHLQEELAELGYYDGAHDGVFTQKTEEALRRLQADEGLEESGLLDRPTRAVLGALAGTSDSLSIKALQTALAELGLYDGLIDGDYGPATEAGVEEIQREAGIDVDGAAFGPETAAALNERYEEEVLVKKPVEEVGDTSADQGAVGKVLGPGSKGAAVKRLQKRLARLGYRPGRADGDYGAETSSAVMALEKHEGLGRDGVAGPQVAGRVRDPRGAGPRRKGPRPRIEVDLDRQIAFVVPAKGKVAILNVSTGSGETYESAGGANVVAYTPTGRFSVYRKRDDIVKAPLGSLYRPLYFDRGWALNGAASVSGYPASLGSVRTSDVDQDFVFKRIPKGAAVFVYGTSRGGPERGRPGF
jgi:peptidoglycan hydrolase-like protein with peptidoglycan-binding domain